VAHEGNKGKRPEAGAGCRSGISESGPGAAAMIKMKSAPVWILCACLLASTAMCAPARNSVDTSTVEDWKTNCALRQEYSNGLIFSAVETTTAKGERTVAWTAEDRSKYLAVFKKLALDGVPVLKAHRDRILEEAGKAPGGGSIAILPKLGEMVSSFWEDIEAAAKRHGVSCRLGKE
jgi:hypothetical protein